MSNWFQIKYTCAKMIDAAPDYAHLSKAIDIEFELHGFLREGVVQPGMSIIIQEFPPFKIHEVKLTEKTKPQEGLLQFLAELSGNSKMLDEFNLAYYTLVLKCNDQEQFQKLSGLDLKDARVEIVDV
jgi:hypothetical protein